MFKLFRRWWRYLTARLTSSFEEKADPKVQLEQAIAEAQDQHRRLKEQAANVIAHQKQTEIRLNRTMGELEKVNGNARQAVLMSDEASKSGDSEKAMQYAATAESFANRLITLEREVEDLKQLHLQSTDAANQAKAAVQQNSSALQQKLGERQKLLSQLDQAKMQEQMNTAMASLSETVGQDVPTLDEVRDKIESRYARAKGMSELTESSVESRMLEVFLAHVARLRAEGHANADLAHALRDQVSQHAVNPHRRQQQGDQRKHAEQQHVEAPWRVEFIQPRLHRAELQNRLIGVKAPDCLPHGLRQGLGPPG
jgi:phage shock protein A